MIAADARHRLTLNARRALAAYDDNPHDALAAIDELLQLYPDDQSLQLARLGSLRGLSTRDDRLAWLEQVCNRPGADALLWIEYAVELMNDNRMLPRALHLVWRALRRRRDDPYCIQQLARLTWALGNRVEAVELDLPLTLELLSTMSEAGLGFDAALLRLAETRLAERPLAQEFRSYQADMLAGRPRVQCLRRLSDRLRMPVVATFVSALVQAEQLGMGIAQVLRRQADDVRERRRERANAFALSLPVKRVIPLVVCFLPGLFVWTMGPFFVQLFQLADTFTRVRDLGGGP